MMKINIFGGGYAIFTGEWWMTNAIFFDRYMNWKKTFLIDNVNNQKETVIAVVVAIENREARDACWKYLDNQIFYNNNTIVKVDDKEEYHITYQQLQHLKTISNDVEVYVVLKGVVKKLTEEGWKQIDLNTEKSVMEIEICQWKNKQRLKVIHKRLEEFPLRIIETIKIEKMKHVGGYRIYDENGSATHKLNYKKFL